MAYRNIFISSPAHVSLKNSQLIVKTDREYSFPLEDISTVLIETKQATITSRRLSRMGEAGVLVYLCDDKHLPCAVLTGYNNHSRKYKILQSQLGVKLPLKKRLWQNIASQKIKNQAQVLKISGLNGEKEISSLSLAVKPGDTDNTEATAALKYFKYLFGPGFYRANEDITNARLNYGYAIVRGLVCRNLAVYGFEPSIGIHHHNELNAFNLADDIIEPFRPLVDLLVKSMEDDDDKVQLTVRDKQRLYGLLSHDILIDGQKQPLSYAVEKTVQSYQNSLLSGKNRLKLPEIIPLQIHSYE